MESNEYNEWRKSMSETKEERANKLVQEIRSLMEKELPIVAMVALETVMATYFVMNDMSKFEFIDRMSKVFDFVHDEYGEFLRNLNLDSVATPIAEGIDPPTGKLPEPKWIEMEKENEH